MVSHSRPARCPTFHFGILLGQAIYPQQKRLVLLIRGQTKLLFQTWSTYMDNAGSLAWTPWSTCMDNTGPLAWTSLVHLHGQLHRSNRLDIMIPLTKYACTSEQCADYDKSDDNSYIICRMISHASTSHTYSSRDHHVGLILPSGRTAVALWSSAPTQPGLELFRIRPLVGHTTRL